MKRNATAAHARDTACSPSIAHRLERDRDRPTRAVAAAIGLVACLLLTPGAAQATPGLTIAPSPASVAVGKQHVAASLLLTNAISQPTALVQVQIVLFDAIIAAVVAFAVAWLIARQRASQAIPVRVMLTLTAVGAVVASVVLATAIVPADAVVGALAIMLGGLAGQFAARPGQHHA